MSYKAYLAADRKRRRNLERIKTAARTVMNAAIYERNEYAAWSVLHHRDELIREVQRIFEADCKKAHKHPSGGA